MTHNHKELRVLGWLKASKSDQKDVEAIPQMKVTVPSNHHNFSNFEFALWQKFLSKLQR